MSARADLKEFVDALVCIGVDQLTHRSTLPADAATTVMRRIADRLCAQYARRLIYVPADYDPRNQELVAKYHRQGRTARACTPERIRELSVEYGLTMRHIYNILREFREADMAARQGVLPGLEQPTDQAA